MSSWRAAFKVEGWKQKMPCTYTFDYYGSYPDKRIPKMIYNAKMQQHISLQKVKDMDFEYQVTLWADNVENLQKYLSKYHRDELTKGDLRTRVQYD